MTEFEPVIGMEVHVELQTKSKMFCGCEVDFGKQPNTRCCPVCLGFPGSLPVVNRAAVEYMVKAALALNCKITPRCKFHRKNYFYPDLPKNYQISQFDTPLGVDGWLEIKGENRTKKIAVRRVHMEEDTGKLLHMDDGSSLVDYNRGGVPLMEIVTMNPPPEGLDQIETAEEAREYLQRLRTLLIYLGVSDCRMEEGSMRCEPNVSIRPIGQRELGTKVELKNLNSFRAVHLGIQYELKRQESVLRAGEKVVHETRRWDDANASTATMRVKEAADEYRYFAEPDLVPLEFEESYIEGLRTSLPELPFAKGKRFESEYGITSADSDVLTENPELAGYFEHCVKCSGDAKAVSNWILGEFLRLVNLTSMPISQTKITPEMLAGMLKLLDNQTINRNIAKIVFEEMFETGKSAEDIVEQRGLRQVTDHGAIEEAVNRVIAANPNEVERYVNGEDKLMGWFVGQVMKESRGKANPGAVSKLLKDALDALKGL